MRTYQKDIEHKVAPTGQIWDILNSEINSDNNEIQATDKRNP